MATHSPKRARKDERNRSRGIGKLCKRLEKSDTPASQSNKGTARLLTFPDGRIQLKKEKIADAAKWDGLRGIVAWDHDDADTRDLVIQYRKTSEIETCFRVGKHDLKLRPVHHWRMRRVRAHITICRVRNLRQRLKVNGHPMSADRIRRTLNQLRYCILVQMDGPGKFGVSHQAMPEAEQIYRTLGLKWTTRAFMIEPVE